MSIDTKAIIIKTVWQSVVEESVDSGTEQSPEAHDDV